MGSHSVTYHLAQSPGTGDYALNCALTPARQNGILFTYTGEMEGWDDLHGWLYKKKDSHQSNR